MIRRDMADIASVMVLARLTVDAGFQKLGIGMGLLQDMLLCTMQAASIIRIRAVLVHPLDDDAASF